MTDYASFRQRLDEVLQTRDIQRVSDFLIAEGQWDEGTPAEPEFAMYMMIAASPNLNHLHAEARQWLIEHGYEGEAQAVLNRAKAKPTSGRGKSSGSAAKKGGQEPIQGKQKSSLKRKHTGKP